MRKWTILIIHSFLICLAGCSKLDNYEAPNGTLFGNIIDSVTKQPILTEQPNGIQIRYIEQNYINPKVSVQNFFVKDNGTYERAMLFAATYKVIPVEGAFFPVTDTALVTINENGRTELNFTVTPYLNLTANARADGNNIIVTYNITRPRAADKIIERKALVSVVPTVNNTTWFKNVTTSTSSITDNVILSTTYNDTIKSLASGTYYVRAAARTGNAYNKFNYSSVATISIP